MKGLLLLALIVMVISPFVTIVGYIVVAHMKPIVEAARVSGERVWWAWQAVAWICGAIAYPGDILWNLTLGSYIFRERPRELTFTSRVKRHFHSMGESTPEQLYSAGIWFRRLNRIWAGHIKDRRGR